MTYINRLKYLRVTHDLSQKNVANMLSISQQAYNNYELGKREPDVNTLIKLAKYYNVTLDYLVGMEETVHDQSLTKEQEDLLTCFDKLDPETQNEFKKLIELYDIKRKVDTDIDRNDKRSTSSAYNG